MSDTREQVEQRLAGLYQLLQRFEGLQQQKDAAYQRHGHLYSSYKTTWRAGMYWLWVLVLTVAVSVIMVAVVVPMVTRGFVSESSAATANMLVASLGLFFVPLPAALVLAGILTAVRNQRVPDMNARLQAANQEVGHRIAHLVAPEVAPIDAQLAVARQEFKDGYAAWFPEKFLSSADVGAIWRIVHDHRASSVQEAVNRYLTDQHEQFVRDAASAQLAEQERATRVARTNGIISTAMQGAMIGTMIDQGNRTRAAMAAPVTVRLRR